jgi:hypothetical protein
LALFRRGSKLLAARGNGSSFLPKEEGDRRVPNRVEEAVFVECSVLTISVDNGDASAL